MSAGSPIIGIDLGTTNSLVAVVQNGIPVVLDSASGEHLVPSVVSLVGGIPVVGRAAKRAKVTDARHTVFSVKRLLGRGFVDIKAHLQEFPFEVVPSSDGVVRIRLGDRSYTAVEISAMILGELKRSAEKSLGQPISRAVITVPAYFNDSQRQATRAAGRLAGLDVLRIVNEPTAAALAYGLDRKRQGLIAVYDLGGGTFDVSILRLHDGIFEVLATNGDTSLGGDDLDRELVRLCAREIESLYKINVSENVLWLAGLIEAAEKVKIALSTQESAQLELMLGTQRFSRLFTRGEFDSLVRPLLERTREPCRQALKDAGLSPDQLSDVILVGGPTRLAVVKEVAKGIFEREPNTSVHPDEVVAAGAAIQADILAGNSKDLLLLDVIPLSLGIETYGGIVAVLIPRNTTVPAVARETFTTFVENQTGVDIHILQGERDRVDDNRSLARFKLAGIDPLPAGLPRIEVTFLIDADGILQVAAKDQRTGREQSIEVRPSFGLSEGEITRMLEAQSAHSLEDEKYRQLVEARLEAEPVLRATEKNLPSAERLLGASVAAKIAKDSEGLKHALEGSDPDQIRAASYQLSQSTGTLAEKILADALRERAR